MDFTGSCRHSARPSTPTPREPCCPAAPAAGRLPSRTAWPPRPWGRLALMCSTEPSPLTRALQCMTCPRHPRASSGSPFAAGPKTPRSCRSAPWTAVLASSPLSIRKAKRSPGLRPPLASRTFVSLVACSFPALVDCVGSMSSPSRRLQTHSCASGRQGGSGPGVAGMAAAAAPSLWACW